MSKTRKLVFMALLTALELVIWVIEAQIPAPVPVPGVKLGLASVITLTAMAVLGRREAGAILLARVLLGTLFAVSVFGAIGHNAGQLLAAVMVTGTPGILWYGPALLAAAIITGAFTGLGAMYLTKALRAYTARK